MDYTRPEALVSTRWLAEHLSAPDVRIVDASYTLAPDRSPRAEYEACHIPGAVFFDIDDVADRSSPWKHTVPSAEIFAARVRKLGLGDGNHVVVYDSNGSTMAACRVWWLFRLFGARNVSVLNGGLAAWLAEGLPVEDLPPQVRDRHFTARMDTTLLRSAEDVLANIDSGRELVVDARSAGRFLGSEPEPRADLRGGRIPGSANLPYLKLVDPVSKAFLPADQLAEVFAASGISLDRPLVASCGSGVTACVVAMAAFLLGKSDVAIFDGSWTEWGSRHELPVVSGPL